jgi:hypothetical protein
MRLSPEGIGSAGLNNTLHGLVFTEGNLPMKTDFAIFIE